MKKQKKKVLFLSLFFACVVIVGFICYQKFYTGNEDRTINVWLPWNEKNDIRNKLLKKYEKIYEKENNNIEINIVIKNQNGYRNEIIKSLENDKTKSPDIFLWWGAGDLEKFIKYNKIVEFDKYLNLNFKRSFGNNMINKENVVRYLSHKDKLYGMPYNLYLATLYVNEYMFETNGIELPTDYEKLLRSSYKFRKIGIEPVALPGKDKWSIQLWLNNLYLNRVGYKVYNEFLENDLNKNYESLFDSVEDFRNLLNSGIFEDNFEKKSYSDSADRFISGEIPMILMGNWIISEIQSNNNTKVKDKIIPLKFPEILGEDGEPLIQNNFLGGVIESFVVNANSNYKKDSAKFAFELAKYISIEGYKLSKILPVYSVENIKKDDLDPMFRRLLDTIDKSKGNSIWWDVYIGKDKGDKVLDSFDSIVDDEYNEEDFLKDFEIEKNDF